MGEDGAARSEGVASRRDVTPSEGQPAFRRILLKLSGEALMGELEYGADRDRIGAIADAVKGVTDRGVEMAVVVGGGNIYRGLSGAAEGMDRATGDYMGMLATVLNALALPSPSPRWPSRISAAGPSATWRRAGS
jgi:hypothetical protein